jgi:hypothetical protein
MYWLKQKTHSVGSLIAVMLKPWTKFQKTFQIKKTVLVFKQSWMTTSCKMVYEACDMLFKWTVMEHKLLIHEITAVHHCT